MAKKKASKKKASSKKKSSPKKKAAAKPVVKAAPKAPEAVSVCRRSGSVLGPVLLVAIGLYLLGRDVGWFHIDSALWSVLIIVLGLVWLFSTLDRRQVC